MPFIAWDRESLSKLCGVGNCSLFLSPKYNGYSSSTSNFKIIMTFENLEAEVLSLPRDSQATLLARLLERLGQSNEIDRDVSAEWVEEAELRDRAMDEGQVTGIDAEQVFQQIRTSL
jgi:hypothetical protein